MDDEAAGDAQGRDGPAPAGERDGGPGGRRPAVAPALGLLTWTAVAVVAALLAKLGSADTTCGSAEQPRVEEPFGAAFTAVAVVWLLPFALLALRRRTRWAGVLAVAALLVAGAAVADEYLHPLRFCF